MAEILTESFCERCGTRYTFESATPRRHRLGGFKTLSKGLRNFVLSDDTSLDEALAAARGEEEREATVQQLDAFHKTFNFCMRCRQYTCSNCWDIATNHCRSCAPQIALHGSGAVLPEADEGGLAAGAWPVSDTLDQAQDATSPREVAGAEGLDRLASLFARDEAQAEPAPEASTPTSGGAPGQAGSPSVDGEPAVADHAPEPPAAVTEEPEDLAAVGAAQTKDLLSRFRPGQSLDEALEAYEAMETAADAEGAPEPVFGTPEPERVPVAPEPVAAEPEQVAVAPEPEPEPVAATPEPEPVTAEPEPKPIAAAPEPEPEPLAVPAEPEPVAAEPEPVAAAPEPEPEPIAAEHAPVAPEPEPVAAAPEPEAEPIKRDDQVGVPAWRTVPPEAPAAADGHPAPAPSEPLAPAASVEPQWPTKPEAEVPFLAAQRLAARSTDALWAASSAELAAGPAPRVGIQSCISCGLSLSATARFCRRCGTRQEG